MMCRSCLQWKYKLKLMVEVFKTDVNRQDQANMLIDQIHKSFNDYKANFDLEDCDKILRVRSETGIIQPYPLIHLLNSFGFNAEVLTETIIFASIPDKLNLNFD